jgi:hypothetical protein
MRLTEEERVLLHLLENALDVSEYTDTVDVFARKPKSDRIISGLVDILSISSGLMVSNNLNKGEGLMKTNSLGLHIFSILSGFSSFLQLIILASSEICLR